jgi:hypothetical protein
MVQVREQFSEEQLYRWTPRTEKDKTLREIFLTLPGNTGSLGLYWIWLLENPSSPIPLSGSIDLYEHDCVHIVLSRGLLN